MMEGIEEKKEEIESELVLRESTDIKKFKNQRREMMKGLKKAILIGMSLMTLGLAGCGGEKKAQEAEDGKVKLTFFFPVNVGGKAANLVSEMTEQFNSQNSDIVVEPVYTGNYDDTVTKIQTAAQGGNPPELFVSLATQRFTLATCWNGNAT